MIVGACCVCMVIVLYLNGKKRLRLGLVSPRKETAIFCSRTAQIGCFVYEVFAEAVGCWCYVLRGVCRRLLLCRRIIAS